ncbi:MAG: amidohydrolase [Anaerolineae bacterium]|nr:amidohydrolase [Anaerolineae bacterium]
MMQLFVNHVHLMPGWMREDATPEAFDRLADALGIEGAVCFAPFSYQVAGRVDHNRWLAEALAGRADRVGYGTLDPTRAPEDQVRAIADLGFPGIKLHPPAQHFHIFDDWSRRAYAEMEKRGLIADFHLGVHWHRLRDYDPLLCDEIAHHFPGLKMVYEHVGGWHYFRQVLAVITNNHNRGNHLYAGIASVLDRENQRYWYLGPDGLDDCRWQIGEDLLIYGLDFPYNGRMQIARDLALIRGLPWPDEARDKLLGGNLLRLIGRTGGTAGRVGGDPVSVR